MKRAGLRAGLAWLREKTRKEWLVRHDILILRKRRAAPAPSQPRFDVVEHRAFHEGIVGLYRRFDRDLWESRLRLRFDRGHRFYELREAGRTLATTWAVARGERFVDEIGLGFVVTPEGGLMRDHFVEPQSRGHGLFAVLLDAVRGRFFTRAETLWSAVSTGNRASVKAHMRFGHEVVVRYDVVHILGRILLRLRWPERETGGSSFQIRRRALLTGPSYRRFIADHLA